MRVYKVREYSCRIGKWTSKSDIETANNDCPIRSARIKAFREEATNEHANATRRPQQSTLRSAAEEDYVLPEGPASIAELLE
jgi:hypothetical protein